MEHVLAALTPANRLVCRVCVATGLRVGDVVALRTAQLRPQFWITEQKTGKHKEIALNEQALEARHLRLVLSGAAAGNLDARSCDGVIVYGGWLPAAESALHGVPWIRCCAPVGEGNPERCGVTWDGTRPGRSRRNSSCGRDIGAWRCSIRTAPMRSSGGGSPDSGAWRARAGWL